MKRQGRAAPNPKAGGYESSQESRMEMVRLKRAKRNHMRANTLS